MIRVAALADVHFGVESAGSMRPSLEGIDERADVLLLGGDLTRAGLPEEAAVVASEFGGLPVPTFAVLGNHDYHNDREDLIRKILEEAGIVVLEGEATTRDIAGVRVAVAGSKGFGGGFHGANATEFGEPEMRAFAAHTKHVAARLEEALRSADGDVRLVMLHYSPVEGTLVGERLEIYPFLGSYLLAEAIDRAGADLVIHGHAHLGSEKGVTPGGVHVRNVAVPVIRHAYNLYSLGSNGLEP